MTQAAKVAVIGAGIMGSAIATRLIDRRGSADRHGRQNQQEQRYERLPSIRFHPFPLWSVELDRCPAMVARSKSN